MTLSLTRIVESFLGTGAALVVVVGLRRLSSVLALRALRTALQLKGRLR